MHEDIAKALAKCLHCLHTRAGKLIPRPLGEALHGKFVNAVIHFDFMYVGPGYIMLIVDDVSHYCDLWYAESPTASAATSAFLEWFGRFGIAPLWCSDQGTHFKNTLMDTLSKQLGADHHFVHAHTPWANGTVERCNGTILNVLRSIVSKRRMQIEEWPTLPPLLRNKTELMLALTKH